MLIPVQSLTCTPATPGVADLVADGVAVWEAVWVAVEAAVGMVGATVGMEAEGIVGLCKASSPGAAIRAAIF